MNISGVISGACLIVAGLACIMLGFAGGFFNSGFVLVIFGLLTGCAGAYMIINYKKEDEIELIKRDTIKRLKKI